MRNREKENLMADPLEDARNYLRQALGALMEVADATKAISEAHRDAANGGVGWVRVNPDGSLDRIAPEVVYLTTDQS
jgi:hypothetical protein